MIHSAVATWFTHLKCPSPIRAPSETDVNGSLDGGESHPPDWQDLRLETRTWANGQLLDLRLEYCGEDTGRCLVARKGVYLVEPTGPSWVREILMEAVQEWCAGEADPA